MCRAFRAGQSRVGGVTNAAVGKGEAMLEAVHKFGVQEWLQCDDNGGL